MGSEMPKLIPRGHREGAVGSESRDLIPEGGQCLSGQCSAASTPAAVRCGGELEFEGAASLEEFVGESEGVPRAAVEEGLADVHIFIPGTGSDHISGDGMRVDKPGRAESGCDVSYRVISQCIYNRYIYGIRVQI